MATLRIHELPAEERPREKLATHGAGALSDSELIAILLRTGMQGANAIDVARKLLAEYHSLGGLARCNVAELSKIKGVGPAKAVQLAAAFGLAARLARESLVRQRLDTPQLINELLGPEMRGPQPRIVARRPARYEISPPARRGDLPRQSQREHCAPPRNLPSRGSFTRPTP